MSLNTQHFYQHLSELVQQRPVCIAYSGGVDSHVLLHLLSQTPSTLFPSIRAIHINHDLHADASIWSKQCLQTAENLGIACQSITVNVSNIENLGLEAAAREARYQALQAELNSNEVLLTAQHQQDQAETLLLQLLRGAGPQGLAAMQSQTRLFNMDVVRPLLSTSKGDILSYAKKNQLQWIEDPSNSDTQINRNYLRHQVIPLLEQRWPAVSKTLSRSAQHCEDSAQILKQVAEQDALTCRQSKNSIDIEALLKLDKVRQRNVLRYLIEQAGIDLPSSVQTQQIIEQVCLAKADATPVLSWSHTIARRYQSTLYIELNQAVSDVALWQQKLNGLTDITLADQRVLSWQASTKMGLKKSVIEQGLVCRYRQGGERIRLHGHRQHKTLKHLFQEWQIPPWQRAFVPLLFCGEELIAVVGYGLADGYTAQAGEQAYLPIIVA